MEGLGPKAADALRQAGIASFAHWPKRSPDRNSPDSRRERWKFCTCRIPAHGPDKRKWRRPGEWSELKQWQDKLQGGIEADADQDDLTKVEGIGPKIAEVLKSANIRSFIELATPIPSRFARSSRRPMEIWRCIIPAPGRNKQNLPPKGNGTNSKSGKISSKEVFKPRNALIEKEPLRFDCVGLPALTWARFYTLKGLLSLKIPRWAKVQRVLQGPPAVNRLIFLLLRRLYRCPRSISWFANRGNRSAAKARHRFWTDVRRSEAFACKCEQ